MKVIPPDDILEVYGKLSNEKKSAVTNLIHAGDYVAVCACDKEGKKVTLDWQASQAMSIHLILGVIMTGRNEYGRIWLNGLKREITQIA